MVRIQSCVQCVLTCDLDNPSVVNDAVGGLEPSVVHPVYVEVGHGSRDVRHKGEAERPVERDIIILQHIVETALGTVLSDDGNVGHFDGSTHKLAKVGMIQFSAWEWRMERLHKSHIAGCEARLSTSLHWGAQTTGRWLAMQ